MIIYKDILVQLANAGYTTYRITKEGILSSATINRLRRGAPITTETLDRLCTMLQCQPGDLLAWEPPTK